MLNSIKIFALAFFCTVNMYKTNAQSANENRDTTQNEIITIHKKNPVKEKVTVVIDKNDITINGKPVDDFKSDDIDVTINDLPDISFDFANDIGAIAPTPPQIKMFRNDMTKKIKTNAAFLGVMSEKTEQGAKITDVTKNSAAEKAGLKEGDIITKIDNTNIYGPDDLYKTVGQHKPDDKIGITYLRNSKQVTVQAVLGKSDQMKVYSWNAPGGQFDMKGFNPHSFSFDWNDDRPRLGIEAQDTEDGNGVKITNIDDEDEPAAKAGLKEDDVITQVNGKAINSVDDLKESVKNAKKGDTLKITYKRNNQTQTIEVKFPKDLKTIDL